MGEVLSQHGGARPGQGRPPELARQLAEAKKLRGEMQKYVGLGLGKMAEVFPRLIEMEIRDAEEGDKEARRFLINLTTKLVKVADEGEESPLGSIMKQLLIQVNGGTVNVAGHSENSPSDAPGHTLP